MDDSEELTKCLPPNRYWCKNKMQSDISDIAMLNSFVKFTNRFLFSEMTELRFWTQRNVIMRIILNTLGGKWPNQ